MKKQILVILLNSVIGLLVWISMMQIYDSILMLFIAPLVIFPVTKFIEKKMLKSTATMRYLNMMYPCLVWIILILIYWYFVDIPRGGLFSGSSIIFIISPILVFILNVVYELLFTLYAKKRQ